MKFVEQLTLGACVLCLFAMGLPACDDDVGQGQGAFCENVDDCMLGLICVDNICSPPDDSPCEPTCNEETEACFDGACVLVVNVEDVDEDGVLAEDDCDDTNRLINPAAFEFCDGVDNNCDGVTDEGCPACLDGSTADCGDEVGECMTGVMTCVDGVWSNCTAQGPVPERCDGLDNDCDGRVDEICPCHIGDILECSTSEGTCMAGNQECQEGTWGACVNGVAPRDEKCDGLDNDCDGLIDDGFAVGAQCMQAGECGVGAFECAGELTALCSTGPGGSADASNPELCNGLDDDCDGETDEDFPGVGEACDGDDSDFCENGIMACTPDQQGAECLNESITDIVELCNDLDDDCDGVIDEDYHTHEPCTGLGGCGDGEGIVECAGDMNVRCSTNPGGSNYTPVYEICDGLDNDCDGETDEDFPELGEDCDGDDADECKHGHYTCSWDGAEAECVNETITNINEACNGVDDDCDGETDETYPILGENCNADADPCQGVVQCQASGDGTFCNEPPDQTEEADPCNGLDDDCNNIIDDVDNDGDNFNPCAHGASWDCCDFDSSVNPSHSGWHSTVFSCNGVASWDYNCNRVAEKRYNSMTIPCIKAGWVLSCGVPGCGQRCAFITSYSFPCWPNRTENKAQECR
ncbi:MAG: putative metal-binding motif-containing protein [Deltaproteobacteria bacterium]|nr:putative metal-binding motif-containing protein [Deltaproteobacteria bacterium]